MGGGRSTNGPGQRSAEVFGVPIDGARAGPGSKRRALVLVREAETRRYDAAFSASGNLNRVAVRSSTSAIPQRGAFVSSFYGCGHFTIRGVSCHVGLDGGVGTSIPPCGLSRACDRSIDASILAAADGRNTLGHA